MGFRRNSKRVVIASLLFCGQAAQAWQASDSIYVGDCKRARDVQEQSTISVLLPFSRYEGIARSYFNSESNGVCQTEQIEIYSMQEKSRSASELVYAVSLELILRDRKPGCNPPRPGTGPRTGTVTFTSRLLPSGELCDYYIWSNWSLSTTSNTVDWEFANRIVPGDNGTFTLGTVDSVDGAFQTPTTFVGVNP